MPARLRVIPGFGAELLDRLPAEAEHVRRMLPNLLTHQRHRLAVKRHGDGLARLRLVGMYLRQLSRQINLLPLQTGDIRCPQARRERERRHVCQMLGQFGKQALRFFLRQKANAPGRLPQQTNLRGPR
jgi:hypothetical protein